MKEIKNNNWFDKIKIILYKSHTTIEDNKKFRIYYSLCLLVTLLLFVCAAACWTYSGITLKEINNIWLITGYTFGFVFFVIGIITGIFFGAIIPMAYQESKMDYFKSDEYKKLKLKFMNKNLNKENKKYVKSLYKLQYIDKIKYQQYLDFSKK